MSSAAKTKVQHTPGPYNIRPLKGPYGYDIEIDVEPDCTWQVARVNGHTPEQALANAHLIAAAPEMYEALKALVRATVERDNPRDMGVFSGDEEVVAAQAAIAKAEGRQ